MAGERSRNNSATAARSIQSSVLVERTVFGRALRGNQFAETLNRKILVYLPPGYHAPANRHRRYPVVYLLAGLGGDHRNFAADGTPNRIAAGRPQMIGLGLDMQEIADQLIANNAIDEAILVGVSGMNTLSNHWFACSEVIGDYRSHVARDIVRYVDRNFRTRRNRNHRALIGHSSGAFGALSLAIEYPHKFGAVAVLGPAGNDLAAAVPPSALPRLIQLFFLANPTAIGDPVLMPVDGSPIPDGPFWELWGTTPAGGKFINNAIFSLAGVYSPNPNNPPFLVDLPFMYPQKVVVPPILDLWLDDDLVSQVTEAAGNLATTPVYLHRGHRTDSASSRGGRHPAASERVHQQRRRAHLRGTAGRSLHLSAARAGELADVRPEQARHSGWGGRLRRHAAPEAHRLSSGAQE